MKSPIALRIFLMGIVVLLLTTVPIFLNKASASSVVFQDNFNSDPNGSFPSKWDLYPGSTCPNQWTVQDGILKIPISYSSCGTNIIPNKSLWSDALSNYTLDLDMTFISGTDHNLVYRMDPSTGNFWEIHFQTPGDFSFDAPSGEYKVNIPGNYPNGYTYHIRVIVEGNEIQVLINNVLVRDYQTDNLLPAGIISLRAGVGGDSTSETWFDNVVVTSLDETPTPTPSPTPTPTPTPSPTPTPTPTPIPTLTPTPTPPPFIKLNVPVLRQTDSPWGSQTYDGANFWSPLAKAIKNWGCTLTSYTMVLKFFGINKLPSGINLDPGTLNNWLKDNNGYIDGKNSGYVNPLAISSLSKKAAKINKITAFDALEYTRINSSNNSLLTDQIKNNHPVVLEEPGHFIVANGIIPNTFSIIDPYYTGRTDLSAYGNTFNSLNELIPSKTDLSYIMVTGDANLDMQIKDSNGNNLGEQFDQQPLVNPENNKPAGDPIKIDYFPKPQSGSYSLTLTSNATGTYDVNVYSYDKNGDVRLEDFPIISHAGKNDIIDINFNSQNSNNSNIRKEVTFDSLINDINGLKSLHLISARTAKELIESVNRIQKHYDKKFKWFTELELRFFDKTLEFHDKKQLSEKAYNIISDDIEDLIKSL